VVEESFEVGITVPVVPDESTLGVPERVEEVSRLASEEVNSVSVGSTNEVADSDDDEVVDSLFSIIGTGDLVLDGKVEKSVLEVKLEDSEVDGNEDSVTEAKLVEDDDSVVGNGVTLALSTEVVPSTEVGDGEEVGVSVTISLSLSSCTSLVTGTFRGVLVALSINSEGAGSLGA
jgi:hypothetical protein